MSCALVIHPDGEVAEVNLAGETRDRLEVMYKAIGCHTVDVVRLTSRLDMWIDDEGLFTQPVNLPATALARHYGRTSQYYHGTAIIAGLDGDGNSVDLTDEQARSILTRLQDVASSL